MKNYLAIFTGTPEGMEQWKALDADTRARREREGMAAWQAWMERNAKVVVTDGSPLGKTKRVTDAGIADIRNQMAAWTVVRAESHEAAAKLFEGHPHFTIFPGDGIEVMECLPIPGQG
jgi:leucyl aminopeptidase (aminopeptidase T)